MAQKDERGVPSRRIDDREQLNGEPEMTEIPCEDTIKRLESQLDEQIKKVNCRRRQDKAKAFVFEFSTLVLSGSITVLLGLRGLNAPTQTNLANIALVLGALATVMAAVNTFFSYRSQWINRTRTLRRLEEIARNLEFYKLTKGSEPRYLNGLHDQVGQVLKDDLEAWAKLRGESS